MLSQETIQYFKMTTKLTNLCHSTPLNWNKEVNRVQPGKSKMAKILFCLSFSTMLIYFLFLIGQIIHLSLLPLEKKKKLSYLISVGYNAFIYSVPLSFQLTFFIRWNEFPNFINGYMDFFERFQELFMITQQKPMKNGCEKLLKVFYILAILITIQNYIVIWRAPHRHFLLSSIVARPGHPLPISQKLFFVLIHSFIWLNIWSQLLSFGCILYAYVFPEFWILKEMTCTKKMSSTMTKNVLRTPEMFMYIYRCLQVQQNIFNFIFKENFMPLHKISFTGVAVFGIYGAVKLSGPRSIVMGLVAYGVMVHMSALFRRLGQLYVASDQLLLAYQGRSFPTHDPMRLLIKKFLKSTHPLTVHISSYYFVKKTTVLNLWIVVINGAITLLLST